MLINMSRNPKRDLSKSFGAFEIHMKLVEHALQSTKTKAKKLEDLKDKLEAAFLKFDEDFRFYRADVIEKECQTLEAFNAVSGENPEPNFPQNDAWSEKMMMAYIATTEDIEEKIDTLQRASSSEARPEVDTEADEQPTLVAEIEV